jgi:hypothetical protein
MMNGKRQRRIAAKSVPLLMKSVAFSRFQSCFIDEPEYLSPMTADYWRAICTRISASESTISSPLKSTVT